LNKKSESGPEVTVRTPPFFLIRTIDDNERVPPFFERWVCAEYVRPGAVRSVANKMIKSFKPTGMLVRCVSRKAAEVAQSYLEHRDPDIEDPLIKCTICGDEHPLEVGELVIIRRGSRARKVGPGKERNVPARYLSTNGYDLFCQLVEDDPYSVGGWDKAGDIGHWGIGSIRSVTQEEVDRIVACRNK